MLGDGSRGVTAKMATEVIASLKLYLAFGEWPEIASSTYHNVPA